MGVIKNDKFVCCWGYDQTQYSVYNVVDIKGKSVFVEGLNSWSNIEEYDLATGSKVKIYKFKHWQELTEEERAKYKTEGLDYYDYERLERKQAIEQAKTKTIVKVQRVNKNKYGYLWTFDDRTTYDSTEDWQTRANVHIVYAIKKCLVQTSKYDGSIQIRINEVIKATLDKNYDQNAKKYREQNLFTAYNGR